MAHIIYFSFYLFSILFYFYFVRKYQDYIDKKESALSFEYGFGDWIALFFVNIIPFMVIAVTIANIPNKYEVNDRIKNNIKKIDRQIERYNWRT